MLDKKFYANKQKVYEIKDDTLTYYFKDGRIKAFGHFVNNKMEGEWLFYRESGQLWQIGNFLHNQKHGQWQRYDRDGNIEYLANFQEGRLIKK